VCQVVLTEVNRVPCPPQAAAARLSRVSKLASAPKTWNTNRPPGVVVSMFSCTDLKPTPLASRSLMSSMRCGNDRPSRSNRLLRCVRLCGIEMGVGVVGRPTLCVGLFHWIFRVAVGGSDEG